MTDQNTESVLHVEVVKQPVGRAFRIMRGSVLLTEYAPLHDGPMPSEWSDEWKRLIRQAAQIDRAEP